MTHLQAVILGVIQGLTEFLPISSSGHLVLGKAFFGLGEADILFDVLVHVGTLLAILTYYRRFLADRLRDLAAPRVPGCGWLAAENWSAQSGRGLLLFIVAGSVPTALIGLGFKDTFERAFSSLAAVGGALLLTALLVGSTYWSRRRAGGELSVWRALMIGLAQGIAILPGLSRSGTTLAAAFWLKVNPAEAARFSFLLSVPAILGALLLKMKDADLAGLDVSVMLAGFAASALTGYLALVLLVRVVLRGHLHWFALWCLVAAAAAFGKALL